MHKLIGAAAALGTVAAAALGTTAASASTKPATAKVGVSANVSHYTDSVKVTSPPISFNGNAGTTVKQSVSFKASSNDPHGFKVTVEPTSGDFKGAASLSLSEWSMTDTDLGSPVSDITPVTVYSTHKPGSTTQTDHFSVTIPSNAAAGTYKIPGGGLEYSVVDNS